MTEQETKRMEVWRLVETIAEMANNTGEHAHHAFVGYIQGTAGAAEDSEPGNLYSRHLRVALALADVGMSPTKVAGEMRRMNL